MTAFYVLLGVLSGFALGMYATAHVQTRVVKTVLREVALRLDEKSVAEEAAGRLGRAGGLHEAAVWLRARADGQKAT